MMLFMDTFSHKTVCIKKIDKNIRRNVHDKINFVPMNPFNAFLRRSGPLRFYLIEKSTVIMNVI